MTVSKWIFPIVGGGLALLTAGTSALARRASGRYELPEVSFSAEEAGLPVQLRSGESAPDAEPGTVPEPERDYIVKLKDGSLFVYEVGKREPLARYAFEDAGLPDYDRTLLEYGIRITGQEALREVLEDYAS
ncbi:MAG: hypothetical protein IJ060_00260 [Oscillospiraceae bacterium]|nr:hypothetical protein [Oscillospiraceae bacterium]